MEKLISTESRLIVKDYMQNEGLEYFDTYSPVMRIIFICVLIDIAVFHNFEIHKIEVKTTILNDNLIYKIYMVQIKWFITPGQENKTCRLVKSLYRLKQAPKQ